MTEQELSDLGAQTTLALVDRVHILEDLARRGYALVALASHTVDDRYSKWHETAERFLRDYVEANGAK